MNSTVIGSKVEEEGKTGFLLVNLGSALHGSRSTLKLVQPVAFSVLKDWSMQWAQNSTCSYSRTITSTVSPGVVCSQSLYVRNDAENASISTSFTLHGGGDHEIVVNVPVDDFVDLLVAAAKLTPPPGETRPTAKHLQGMALLIKENRTRPIGLKRS